EGVTYCNAAQSDDWPESSPLPTFSDRFQQPLDKFLTTEIHERYTKATQGFDGVEWLAEEWLPRKGHPADDRMYQEIAVGILPKIHSAYIAIIVNYLAEVQQLMPAYAEASGQKKPEPRVSMIFSDSTFYGGQFAAQIANINSTIAGIFRD